MSFESGVDFHRINAMEHEMGMVHEPEGLHPRGQCTKCDAERAARLPCHFIRDGYVLRTGACFHDV